MHRWCDIDGETQLLKTVDLCCRFWSPLIVQRQHSKGTWEEQTKESHVCTFWPKKQQNFKYQYFWYCDSLVNNLGHIFINCLGFGLNFQWLIEGNIIAHDKKSRRLASSQWWHSAALSGILFRNSSPKTSTIFNDVIYLIPGRDIWDAIVS